MEGFRREVAEHITHQRIEGVRVADTQVVRRVRADRLPDLLDGRYAGVPRRRGKWLVLPTTGSPWDAEGGTTVLFHFGMTGKLRWCPPDVERDRYDRVSFAFRDGELRYSDMRKLKGLYIAEQESDMESLLAGLGPDADEVSAAQCRSLLTRHQRQMKSALMDQSVLAGLGNLSIDEILWRARIHPKRSTADLDDAEWRGFHRRMRSVLRQASRQARIPDRPSWLTGHRDEPGGTCPRCSASLRYGTVAGRGTVWCPRCQPAPT